VNARPKELFSDVDLGEALEGLKAQMVGEIESAEEGRALNADEDEWVAYLVDRARREPVQLRADERAFDDLGERQVDVRGDPNRLFRDTSVPAWKPGHAVKLRIPFEGDRDLLTCHPNLYGPSTPVAGIENGTIVKEYQWPTDVAEAPDLDALADRLEEEIGQYNRAITDAVERHNLELEQLARATIRTRRERLKATHEHLASVKTPIRRRDDAPTTYASPVVQRRPPPAPPSGAKGSRMPEPALSDASYGQAIRVIRAWGKAMERTPEPYLGATEETLRDALLPMLNSHFVGAATGETFNAGGKIDVLIRDGDRNVFIGECKRWSGPKAVTAALAQLFSYTTWRDTRLALLFFVSSKDPSPTLAGAREQLELSEHFIEWLDPGNERELHCRMRWPGDESITAQLHVFFVHLPKP
jgi:hypothetical protein